METKFTILWKTKVVLLFQCESSHACQSLAPLVETKTKKNSFKIIIGFIFTSPLFLATKVAISFVYYSPKTIKCSQKPKIEKTFTGIDQSSERLPFSTSYLQLALAHAHNSRGKKRSQAPCAKPSVQYYIETSNSG